VAVRSGSRDTASRGVDRRTVTGDDPVVSPAARGAACGARPDSAAIHPGADAWTGDGAVTLAGILRMRNGPPGSAGPPWFSARAGSPATRADASAAVVPGANDAAERARAVARGTPAAATVVGVRREEPGTAGACADRTCDDGACAAGAPGRGATGARRGPATGAASMRRRATGATAPDGAAARDPVMERSTTGPRCAVRALVWPAVRPEPGAAVAPEDPPGCRSAACEVAAAPPATALLVAAAPAADPEYGRTAGARPTGADSIHLPDAGVTGLGEPGEVDRDRRTTGPRRAASAASAVTLG
jgi:hypothetical protein